MNLYDLAKRADRSFLVTGGQVQAAELKWPGQTQRAVALSSKAHFTVSRADEFTWSKVRKTRPGWRARSGQPGAAAALDVILRASTGDEYRLARVLLEGDQRQEEILLDWPIMRRTCGEFSFDFRASGEASVELSVGPLLDMRRHLVPLAIGRGLEVGPGVRPAIYPSQTVDVQYVEERHPSEWRALYDKQAAAEPIVSSELAERYVVGSAVALEEFQPSSYDFIFSNHVFEHLPNPVRVLRNWLRILRPGGAILGVIPDPRFTFDCRQPITTLSEALTEAEEEGHEISLAKYERWCRWTTPEVTPASLIERKYSIHVNFFTPATFLSTANAFVSSGEISDACVHASTNHKDFAFALWK